MKKYIIIEKRTEQVWYSDLEGVILDKDLFYIPYEDEGEARTWIWDMINKDIDKLQDKVKAGEYLDWTLEIPEFDIEKLVRCGNYMPYAYDKTEEEYYEVYYMRVYVKEEKSVFEEA